VCRYSPVFRDQPWQRVRIKETTRGAAVWEVKTARVHLVDSSTRPSRPTDRQYWLIVARNPATEEIKYFVSNAPGNAKLETMLIAAFARWHVELWFERAKQETGLGAFEVRTYTSLMRHWLCSRLAMYFLAEETERLRGEKSTDHVGASGRGGEQPGVENLETRLALVG
jgi:SRSO17 transposase